MYNFSLIFLNVSEVKSEKIKVKNKIKNPYVEINLNSPKKAMYNSCLTCNSISFRKPFDVKENDEQLLMLGTCA